MLRRGPWPWRARLLPTPGTQGRAHPRPPMPQVSPSPGRGRRPENFAWGNFGGRESPAEGHACVLLARPPSSARRRTRRQVVARAADAGRVSTTGVTPGSPGRRGRAPAHHLG